MILMDISYVFHLFVLVTKEHLFPLGSFYFLIDSRILFHSHSSDHQHRHITQAGQIEDPGLSGPVLCPKVCSALLTAL